MNVKLELTESEITELLAYNAATGVLTWKRKVSKFSKSIPGSVAGTIDKEYIRIKIMGKSYAAHRIAWLIHYGSWPTSNIDHIDGNHSNNAIANLRDVTQGINCQNIRSPYASNKSRLLGTYPRHKKWAAKLQLNGSPKYLGVFDTAELAHQAYLSAKRELHKGNTL